MRIFISEAGDFLGNKLTRARSAALYHSGGLAPFCPTSAETLYSRGALLRNDRNNFSFMYITLSSIYKDKLHRS